MMVISHSGNWFFSSRKAGVSIIRSPMPGVLSINNRRLFRVIFMKGNAPLLLNILFGIEIPFAFCNRMFGKFVGDEAVKS